MNERYEGKYLAMYEMLKQMSAYYLDACEYQQKFIETAIGAALFYLPRRKNLHYSGFISPEALDTGKECEEHMFPRKIAAEALLTTVPDTIEELEHVCNTLYLRFHIVTPEQNTRLRPYQKREVFTTPTAAYEKAGISLIEDPRRLCLTK